ncbi:MAG TPA: hypothetical protein VJY15_19865 [Candidatus Acidoferrum sp.]|nr:hypothetical protein [Candidatus Acidoferrum sp.]
MKARRKIALLMFLAMGTGIETQAQKLAEDPVPVKKPAVLRVPKIPWIFLSAATYTAAALDMHATADAVELAKKYPAIYWGNPEADPLARPFVKLPQPAYYACGFALATGINWLGYKMSHSRKWRRVWWLPQSISVGANSYGYHTNR